MRGLSKNRWLRYLAEIMRPGAPRLLAFALLLSAFVAPVRSAVAYDIKAELVFHAPNSIYVVQLRNVGPAIPGPVQGKFWLAIPVGTKVANWTLNGWQCAPSPPVQGSVTLACNINLAAAWSPGTILSNQLFFVTFLPGVRRGTVCVRSQVLKPNPVGVYQPVGETNSSNNSLCV